VTVQGEQYRVVTFLTAGSRAAVAKDATVEVAVKSITDFSAKETILLLEELWPAIFKFVSVVVNHAIQR
jgi:hypothetical protein